LRGDGNKTLVAELILYFYLESGFCLIFSLNLKSDFNSPGSESEFSIFFALKFYSKQVGINHSKKLFRESMAIEVSTRMSKTSALEKYLCSILHF